VARFGFGLGLPCAGGAVTAALTLGAVLALGAVLTACAALALGLGATPITTSAVLGPGVPTAVALVVVVAATLSGLVARCHATTDNSGAASATAAKPATSFHVRRRPRAGPAAVVTGRSSSAGTIALGSAALSISAGAPPAAHGLGASVFGLRPW